MRELSIVTPVLNDADALRRLLDDLRVHARDAEIVVVDGGSHDDSAAVARDAGTIVVAASRGRAPQLRAGIGRATRPWIWMLHADSRVGAAPVGALAVAVAAGTPAWGRFDVALSGTHPGLRLVETLMNLRSRLTGIATGDQGIFVHRELLDAIGGVPDQALMEDIELSRRLKRRARPLCLRAHVVTSSRRWEREGLVRTTLLMWRLRFAYFLGADPRTLAARYHGH